MKWHMFFGTHNLIEIAPLPVSEMPERKPQLQMTKPFFSGRSKGMPPGSNGLKSNIYLS